MKNKHHSHALFRSFMSCALMISALYMSSMKVKAVSLDTSLKTTGYNNPIELSGLALKGLNPQTSQWEPVTMMTPTQNVQLQFTVSDFDGLDQVLIEVALVHDEGGVVLSDQSDINAAFESLIGVSESGDEFDFFWNPSMVEGPQLALATETVSTSWALVSSNVLDMPTGALSYIFSFEFKVSKAAIADGQWMLNVRVMDDYRDTPSLTPTTAADRMENLNVQWYGEVSNLGSSALDFGILSAGTPYSASKAQVALNFLSNGPYEQQISADHAWKGTQISDTALGVDLETFKATLVEDPTQQDQSFAIRINPIDSAEKGYTADYLQLRALSQVLSASVVKTGELGLTQNLTLYLQLSERFQNGSYTGAIRFGIANTLP